jgi:hypothetical protein
MSRTLVSLLKYGNVPYCLGEAYPAIFSHNGQPCMCHICCKQRAEFGHMMRCIVWAGMEGWILPIREKQFIDRRKNILLMK